LVVVVAGCYHPVVASDQPCSDGLQCPVGEMCDTQRVPPTCVSTINPVDSNMDVMIDAPPSVCGVCAVGTPVCDTGTKLCRACLKDAECSSNVCSESTGRCIDTGAALYVATNGNDGGQCTKAAPCASISRAATLLDATRATIKVADGTYTDAILTTTPSYLLSGEGNTKFGARINFKSGVAAQDHVLEVQGGTVLVEGLTFSQAAVQEDIRAQGGATLTLWRCEASNSANGNVDISSATVSIVESKVTGGMGTEAAINVSGGTITILRSSIDHNAGGGVRVSNGAKFDIENTFIVANANLGGFVQQGNIPAMAKIELDTIADNTAAATAGATCTATIPMRNTIFSNNGTAPQIAATCTATYSLFSDTAATGTGNIQAAPGFVSGTDYHLAAGSLAIDAADPATPAGVDYDSEVRPHGARADIGADERY
jgi:hypothetical protein